MPDSARDIRAADFRLVIHRARRLLVLGLLGLLVLGCSDAPDAQEPTPESGLGPNPTMTDLGAALGCSIEVVERIDRLSVEETADCRSEDGFVARLHRFPPESEPLVRSFFESRYPTGSTNPCPDGRLPASLSVVMGESWAAVAPTDEAAESIASDLQAELLEDAGPDQGPPVSYSYPEDGFCPPA